MSRCVFLTLFLVACSNETEHVFFRSIGGIANNRNHLMWGAADMVLPRKSFADYGDAVALPAGWNRPSSRAISNKLFVQEGSIKDDRKLSDWVWQWGQFVSHDISLTEPLAKTPESFDVPVPKGDSVFDPGGAGGKFLPFTRSIYHRVTGRGRGNPREQINQVTSFLDASHIYGSETARDDLLRGKKKEAPQEYRPFLLSSNDTNNDGQYLLPRNVFEAANCNYGHPQPKNLFLSGDVRTNEVPGLIVLHTIFMREHNTLVQRFSERFPKMESEVLFEYVRKWLGAELQVVTYAEFLPALLGKYTVGFGGAYDENLDPTVTNEFSTVLFRLGHSMIPPELTRVGKGGAWLTPIPLTDAFFDPKWVSTAEELDAIARGLSAGTAEKIDLNIVESLRSYLFKGTLGQGLDLAALNIQRGRDHGIPSYNRIRKAYGLSEVNDFLEITTNVRVSNTLKEVYGTVEQMDAWVGALAEDHLEGASVGPLFAAGLIDGFTRLRDGDRFWFERDPWLSQEDIEELQKTRLSDIIRRNSGASELPENVFFFSGKSLETQAPKSVPSGS